MQGQKQGLSKFKNCSPQTAVPDKCKNCRMNCGGKCVYTKQQIPEEDEELILLDKSASRKNH